MLLTENGKYTFLFALNNDSHNMMKRSGDMMWHKESVEKKKLELFRNVIDSVLGLESYVLARDGKLSKKMEVKMKELYEETGGMIEESFREEKLVGLLEEVLMVLKNEEEKKENQSKKPKQMIPPEVVYEEEELIGETIVFDSANRYEIAEETENYLETTLLHTPIRIPFLIRKSTKEKILINRDIFKLGKERSYVDYAIDNDAVSRSHADIIRKRDDFFVIDHNSLNHTFLEGREIPAKKYVRLESGQSFLLADEAFTFYYETI